MELQIPDEHSCVTVAVKIVGEVGDCGCDRWGELAIGVSGVCGLDMDR